MNNQYLAVEFLEAAVQPPQPKVILWTYCDHCWNRRDFVLKEETELTEIYVCPDCGLRKEYTVR